ncbi:MAG: anti-sigma factor [Acidobacteria bacterium]|nr:anti-sigma factor [Acidobacteriota bacterium]
MNDPDDLHELTGLYALGALRGEEHARFEAHLEVCERCRAEVRSFSPVVESLSRAGAVVEPPLALRARVVPGGGNRAVVRDLRPSPTLAWLAAAASVVLTIGVGWYAAQLHARIDDLEARLAAANFRAGAAERQTADARQAADRAQDMLGVLSAPDMARVDLKGQGAAAAAAGRAFWSRSRGLVFTATNLPALPAGKVYQLWVVTPTAPVSAGLLHPDDQGRVTTVAQTDPAISPVAMAVTLEPEGGVPSPTGDKYLIGMVAP